LISLSGRARAKNKWRNPTFDALIAALERSDQREALDGILHLRDLSSNAAEEIVKNMHEVWQRALNDGAQHSFSTGDALHKPGLIFVVVPGSHEQLERHLRELVRAKKYQRKASLWLGFGSLVTEYGIITATFVEKGTWTEDPQLADLSNELLRPVPQKRLTPKMDRNAKCHCGSGIKYKKCHGKLD